MVVMIKIGIDALLKQRYHGATNIRGIRYQLLYSLKRAFELYDNSGPETIQFEGIEDVDLKGLHCGNLYVQVKYSSKPWQWSQLNGPIAGYLSCFRENPQARFHLAVNFSFKADIERLSRFDSLNLKENKLVSDKFIRLCKKAGATQTEAEQLLANISFESIPEDEVWKKLKQRCAEAFNLGSEVDSILFVLLGKCLEWGEQRKVISRNELENVRLAIAEESVRQKDFEAFGCHLINRIRWEDDQRPEDFYDGKGTRPGHIAMGIDVRRPKWLERIDQAIASVKTCVVRSSSGQGKSALVYRYALENWPAEHTFSLWACASAEDAERINDYFRFRDTISLPSFLVIEDAGWKAPFWPQVVKGCASLGIAVVIGVRHEDWFRLSKESLFGFEIVEPMLDLNEAIEIFKKFKEKGKLHPSVSSAEWAFEMLGEPALLIEYAYLLTHGQMLEERLKEQVRRFSKYNEDPQKIELLRRVTTAHTAGVPLVVSKLVDSLKLNDDPQQVFQSVEDEYTHISGNLITGLHWVRSNHLSDLLHDKYPDKAKTFLSLLSLVPQDEISTFIANVVSILDGGSTKFIESLAEVADKTNLKVLVACLEGIFRGGEQNYFSKNKRVFDELYKTKGSFGIMLILDELSPSVKVDLLNRLDELGEPFRENIKESRAILKQIKTHARGVDFVRVFLNNVLHQIPIQSLQNLSGDSGEFIDWCLFSGLEISEWQNKKKKKIAFNNAFELEIGAFSNWALSLYRYDEEYYHEWFQKERENIIGYLMSCLELTSLEIDKDILSIKFLVDSEKNPNEQAVSRLQALRAALPFCKEYCSDGIWFTPFGLKVSVDDTHKEIPARNLPFEVDVQKNVVFREIVENAYRPDSYYEFQASWINARTTAINLMRLISKRIHNYLEGRKQYRQLTDNIGNLLAIFSNSFTLLPDPPLQSNENIKQVFSSSGAKSWAFHLENFVRQFFDYVLKQDKNIARLALSNLREARIKLRDMHNAFETLFRVTYDYHKASGLMSLENKTYDSLSDLFDCWVNFPPNRACTNIKAYIHVQRNSIWREKLKILEASQNELSDMGIGIELPSGFYYEHPLSYLGFIVHVDDPMSVLDVIQKVASVFVKNQNLASYFCFIPVHEGTRWNKEGYIISSEKLQNWAENTLEQWEYVVPREVQGGVLNTLPSYPVITNPAIQFLGNHELLLMSLANLPKMWAQIEPFKNPVCYFKKQLFERLKRRADTLANECSETAGKLRTALGELSDIDKDLKDNLHTLYSKIISAQDVEELLEVIREYNITNESLAT